MPGFWPQVNQVQKVDKKVSLANATPLPLPTPNKVSGQPVHTDPSNWPHPSRTVRQARTPPGLSLVHLRWARSPPCSLRLRQGGAASRGVRGGADSGCALVRGGSKPLAGKGCGSHGKSRPLTWALRGPLRWAPSPRRWRGPAAPWCSWARRHRSPRRHRLLLRLAETDSLSPRPESLDAGVERRSPRRQPGRLSPRRGAWKGERS